MTPTAPSFDRQRVIVLVSTALMGLFIGLMLVVAAGIGYFAWQDGARMELGRIALLASACVLSSFLIDIYEWFRDRRAPQLDLDENEDGTYGKPAEGRR